LPLNQPFPIWDFSLRRSCKISVTPDFLCGVTAKPTVLRLHRIKNGEFNENITEICQLRRHENAKAEVAASQYFAE
jgi:hypothetical protein